jgi:hypothetical protein
VRAVLTSLATTYADRMPLTTKVCFQTKCTIVRIESVRNATTCTVASPAPTGIGSEVLCQAPPDGTVTVAQILGSAEGLKAGMSYEVSVEVQDRDDHVLLQASKQATLTASRPNGPPCGPICYAADVAFSPQQQSLTIPDLKFKVADAEGPVRVCGPPVVRSGGDQADADAGFAPIQADTATYAAILRHEHLTPDPASPTFRLAVFHAYQALQAITLAPSDDSYRFEIPTTKRTLVAGTIDRFGSITVPSSRPLLGGCPICLAAGTTISTPNGPIPVSQLRVGMPIWTLGPDGGRLLARVQSVGHLPMPLGHDAVRLVLADGRQVTASAGHPTLDGRVLRQLQVGDILDGSGVISVEIIHLHDSGTYDVLPSGASGAYWANGILLRSTLVPT